MIDQAVLAKASRFFPEVTATVLGLIKALAAKDVFGAAVYSTALVRQIAGVYEDGGKAYFRHLLRELAEHDVSDALADALLETENVAKTPPKVT